MSRNRENIMSYCERTELLNFNNLTTTTVAVSYDYNKSLISKYLYMFLYVSW